jgi:phosphoglycolate phosphatase
MSQRRFKYIIFDWDGTVMDSAGKIVACMQKAAKLSELPIPSAQQVEHIIGISLLPAIQQLFSIGEVEAAKVSSHYKSVFLNEDKTACPLFPSALTTLENLSQHAQLAVATGKARRGLERAFDLTQTRSFFENSRCADEAESKPSSDMLIQLLNDWEIKPEEALMVGDTIYDMQMAQNINMPRVAVSFGVHSVDKLAVHEPLEIIDNFADILKFSHL